MDRGSDITGLACTRTHLQLSIEYNVEDSYNIVPRADQRLSHRDVVVIDIKHVYSMIQLSPSNATRRSS